ncbi:alpha/beta fold hydrolase [Microlunatus parietis]|uniref:Pimeloyl-ACP methyl ester carboxylesterase n=1 Tax=Microlunatus parietis TaxID=682979 RepID=A0A7Y9I2W2_9ACTN|nr:alpha/beta hydrolase [Microlunatus parietis]NYE69117.1 pimeloyl-ACP methyl ester carboxylesterase [Microlunatus parietis]
MTDDLAVDHDSHEVVCPEGRLRVITAGDTGPPVVLLSGGGTDSATLSWRHLIPDLADSFRVFAPDWPKQGRSRPWNGVADHDRLVRCVTEVLDHFGLDRVALVGLSQGGAVALSYAIDHPGRVRRLVALAPGGIIDFPPVVHQLLWLTAKIPFLNRTLPSLMARDRRSTAAFARRALFTDLPADFDEIVDEIMIESRAGSSSSDWQNTSIGPFGMTVDLRPRLSEIRCPTLFLQGDSDVGIRQHFTAAAARLVPGAKLIMLDNTGHWISRQSPELVNPMIKEFLAARG